MKAFLQNEKNPFDHDYLSDDPIFEFDNIEINKFYKFKDKYYIAGRICTIQDYAVVEEIEMKLNPENIDYEKSIICPYCGIKNLDSWAMDDESDDQECGRCGSIFAYQINVELSYSSQPVKNSPIIEVIK